MNKKEKDYSEQNEKAWKKYIQNDWIAATTLTAPDGWSEIVLLNKDNTGAILLSGGISDNYTSSHHMTKEVFENRYGIQMLPKCTKNEDELHKALSIDIDRVREIARHPNREIKNLTQALNRAIAYELANDYRIGAVTMYLGDGSPVIIAPGTSSHSHRCYTRAYLIDNIYTVNDSDCMTRLKGEVLKGMFDYITSDMIDESTNYAPHVSETHDSYESETYYRIWAFDLNLDTLEEAEAICKHFDMIERAKINKNLRLTIAYNDATERDYRLSKMSPEERERNWIKQMKANTKSMNEMYSRMEKSNSEKMTSFVKGRKKY